MYVTTLLSLHLKPGAFEGAYHSTAFDAWKLLTHAADGMESLATKNGSGSVGTVSPSSSIDST